MDEMFTFCSSSHMTVAVPNSQKFEMSNMDSQSVSQFPKPLITIFSHGAVEDVRLEASSWKGNLVILHYLLQVPAD